MSGSIQIWRGALLEQFGAAIEMLENAVVACPDALWNVRAPKREFWYVAFHTLFYLDLYLSGTVKGFSPPRPFDELRPGIRPTQPFTKAEIMAYLAHCREKSQNVIDTLTDLESARRCGFDWLEEISFAELMLYNLRHVQHHTGQLNLILRQQGASVPDWEARAQPRLAHARG